MSLNKKLDELAKELEEADIEEASVTGGGEAYNTKYAFGKKTDDESAEKAGYKKVKESTFMKFAKESMLSEISYSDYKKDANSTSKRKVNSSIKEVASKLFRIERIINQNIKLKTEEGVNSNQYWKSTRGSLRKISERMMRISEKLRKF